MTTDAPDRPAPQPSPSDRPAPAPRNASRPRGGVLGALSAVYRFLYNKFIGLMIILVMAVFVLIGTVVTQSPPGLRQENPQAYATWLETMRPRYGGWTEILNVTGMFHVFSSLWFIAISFLLAASIIACTCHRIPQLWQRAVHPRTRVTERFFDHARQRAAVPLRMPAEQAAARVREDLTRRRYRIVEDPDGPGLNYYADQNRWAPFGTSFAHAGFVLVIAAIVVSSVFGYQRNLPVTVGERVDVGGDTGLQVEAYSFSDAYYDDGRPSDYVADLGVYRNGQEVARQEVRVNDPIRVDGVRFHQSYFGVATVITVTDRSGAEIYSGGVPLQWTSNDEQNSIGRVDLPEAGVDVLVVTAASGQVSSFLAPGQLQFEIYPTGEDQPLGMDIVSQGSSTTIGEYTYAFEREQQYTGIAVHKDPGAILVWIASTLMMLGMIAVFGFRHRRLWVRVHETPTGSLVRIASVEKQDFHFDRTFTQLAAHVQRYDEQPTTD